jgi:hypothetical protein
MSPNSEQEMLSTKSVILQVLDYREWKTSPENLAMLRINPSDRVSIPKRNQITDTANPFPFGRFGVRRRLASVDRYAIKS